MGDTLRDGLLWGLNGTNGTSGTNDSGVAVAAPALRGPLGYAVCEGASFQRETQLLYGAALALAAFMCTQSLLLCVIVSQVKKASRLVRALTKEAGVGGAEVRTNLLAPELRSGAKLQSKSKKSTNNHNKSVTFTDPDNTSCAAPRDVDEEDL